MTVPYWGVDRTGLHAAQDDVCHLMSDPPDPRRCRCAEMDASMIRARPPDRRVPRAARFPRVHLARTVRDRADGAGRGATMVRGRITRLVGRDEHSRARRATMAGGGAHYVVIGVPAGTSESFCSATLVKQHRSAWRVAGLAVRWFVEDWRGCLIVPEIAGPRPASRNSQQLASRLVALRPRAIGLDFCEVERQLGRKANRQGAGPRGRKGCCCQCTTSSRLPAVRLTRGCGCRSNGPGSLGKLQCHAASEPSADPRPRHALADWRPKLDAGQKTQWDRPRGLQRDWASSKPRPRTTPYRLKDVRENVDRCARCDEVSSGMTGLEGASRSHPILGRSRGGECAM